MLPPLDDLPEPLRFARWAIFAVKTPGQGRRVMNHPATELGMACSG
jgi:hypothetical protein